jgi:hypothetical protein
MLRYADGGGGRKKGAVALSNDLSKVTAGSLASGVSGGRITMDLDPVILSRIQFAFVTSSFLPSPSVSLPGWRSSKKSGLQPATHFTGAYSTSG